MKLWNLETFRQKQVGRMWFLKYSVLVAVLTFAVSYIFLTVGFSSAQGNIPDKQFFEDG